MITNASDTAWRRAPGIRRVSGRAIAIRKANSPIAIITDRNITQRVISSCGDVAPAAMFGILNCGAGPGFGPTA